MSDKLLYELKTDLDSCLTISEELQTHLKTRRARALQACKEQKKSHWNDFWESIDTYFNQYKLVSLSSVAAVMLIVLVTSHIYKSPQVDRRGNFMAVLAEHEALPAVEQDVAFFLWLEEQEKAQNL